MISPQRLPRLTEGEIEAHNALATLSKLYEMLGDKRQYKVNKFIHQLYAIRENK